MRHLFALYALLTTSVPVPRQLLLRAAAIVAAYLATAPYAETLARIGLTPLKATVFLGLIIVMLGAAKSTWDKLQQMLDPGDRRPGYIAPLIATAWLPPLVATVTIPSDLWLAYAATATYPAYGVMTWALWKSDPSYFDQHSWMDSEQRPKEAENTMTWQLWRYVWSGVVLLALTLHATPLEWVLGYAAVPVVFHYLYWWTVIATHPLEDGPKQD